MRRVMNLRRDLKETMLVVVQNCAERRTSLARDIGLRRSMPQARDQRRDLLHLAIEIWRDGGVGSAAAQGS